LVIKLSVPKFISLYSSQSVSNSSSTAYWRGGAYVCSQ